MKIKGRVGLFMKTLFDKTSIGPMKLKNRIIRSAAGDQFAVNGHMTDRDLKVYEELARGGVGTIITGFTSILDSDNALPIAFGIYDDSFIPEYKKLTNMVHEYNANIILQLVYYGSHVIKDAVDKRVLAPSAIKHINSNVVPEEMTKEEIKHIQKAFVDAAVRAKKAGFDGVQLHSAHGFLLSQFLTPYYNRRSDEYGGNIENRTRMLLETYSSVRAAVGNEYPILVKINCTDGIDKGITFEGFKYACEKLESLGINAIEVSGDWYQYNPEDESYFRAYAEKIAGENNVAVILVGGNRDYDSMIEILNETSVGYFSMCRPLIAEPNLINRWERGDTNRTKCLSCNGCIELGHEGRCILND